MPSTHEAGFVTCEFCGRELREVEPPAWVADLEILTGAQFAPTYERCDCEEAVRANAERLEAKWSEEAIAAVGDAKSRMRAMALRAGIPERYVLKGMDDRELYEELVSCAESGTGLFITGDTGVGKTHAACAVAQRFLMRGKTVRFADPEQIEREVTASWKRMATGDERGVIARYVDADLVVIDDLGAEQMSSTTMKALRAIISGREGRDAVTVFTSNLTREQFACRVAEKSDEVMAGRLASRIKGMTRMFPIEGPDRRIAR